MIKQKINIIDTLMKKTFIAWSFYFFRILFAIIPFKLSFSFIVLTRLISCRVSFFLLRAFMYTALKKIDQQGEYPLPSFLAARFSLAVAETLLRMGAFQQVVNVLISNDIFSSSYKASLLVSNAYFEMGKFELAKKVLDSYPLLIKQNIVLFKQKILLELLNGNEEGAEPYLRYIADDLSNGWCPHQNLAARYLNDYKPVISDWVAGTQGLLFDAYNYLGQRLTHVGMGHLSIQFYAKSFDIQEKLLQSSIPISEELNDWFKVHDIKLNSFRILSWEWVTQIGHLGMLDILFRMRVLKWWAGKTVILLPHTQMIANKVIVSLFQKEALLVTSDINASQNIVDELFSLQRYFGLSFNAWRFNDGEVVPWQQAGARLLRHWDKNHYGCPLRHNFDSQYSDNVLLNEHVETLKKNWGISPEDWYVCLHIRDPEYYGEMVGSGQTHRNADIGPYMEAIRYITNKGGWVIVLGGNKSYKMPVMNRVIDYAHSQFKSELYDIIFIKDARFFIGTTSGLTNMAVSFGVPCALVNCITTDCQLWNNKVRFILKQIKLSDDTFLSQRQLATTPWRWRVFEAEVLRRYNALVVNNTSDEILEIVKEVDSFAIDDPLYLKNYSQADHLFRQWQNSLPFVEYYGSALPSIYYLLKHEKSFLDPVSIVQFVNNVEQEHSEMVVSN